MSWKIGGLLLKIAWKEDEQLLLSALGITECKRIGHFSIGNYSNMKFQEYAIGTYSNATIVLNSVLFFDLSQSIKPNNNLDMLINKLSIDYSLFSFSLDGISGTYGYSIYEKGSLVRAFTEHNKKIVIDFGIKTDVEKIEGFSRLDGENKIFAITKDWIGVRLDTVVFYDDIQMTLYNI